MGVGKQKALLGGLCLAQESGPEALTSLVLEMGERTRPEDLSCTVGRGERQLSGGGK